MLMFNADTYEKAAKLTENAMDTFTVETEKEKKCFADRSDGWKLLVFLYNFRHMKYSL